MLSKKAQCLLSLMNDKNHYWFTEREMNTLFLKLGIEEGYDYWLLKELCDNEYIACQQSFDWCPTSDYDEPPHEYRILDKGCAFLEMDKSKRKAKRYELIRYIITTVIAVAALVISLISLLTK